MTRRVDRWLLCIAFALTAVVAGTFAYFAYLPMVDLPQHAAQLSAWIHLDDPNYGFAEQFEINWRTPYLLGYLLARPMVPLLGIVGALKFVVLLAALGTLAVYWWLLRTLKQEEWLCLLALPLTFGFSFYFGFINFLLATPLILATVTLAFEYSRKPSWQVGLLFAVVLGVTFLAHALAFAISTACAFLLTARRIQSFKGALRDYWPLLAGLGGVLPWLPGFLSSPEISAHPEQWNLSWGRLPALPATLFSIGRVDQTATIFGYCALALVALSLGRPAKRWSRYALFAIAVVAYMLFPFELRGVSFLFQRFAALLIPGLILLADGPRSLLPLWPRRGLAVLFSAVWVGVFALRMRDFNAEANGFAEVVEKIPQRMRIRPMIFANQSGVFPGAPLYLHFPAYYQAEKGGYLGYSFARYFTCFVHYRPGVDIGMGEDMEWNPWRFDARREVPKYDYFIARSEYDNSAKSFRHSPRKIELEASGGGWWSYRAVD